MPAAGSYSTPYDHVTTARRRASKITVSFYASECLQRPSCRDTALAVHCVDVEASGAREHGALVSCSQKLLVATQATTRVPMLFSRVCRMSGLPARSSNWRRPLVPRFLCSKPLGTFPVAIVGAGPAGLTLSGLLSHFGVPSIVFEKASALPTHPQAHFINFRSMEIMRHALGGVDAAVLERCPPRDEWRCVNHGSLAGSVDFLHCCH